MDALEDSLIALDTDIPTASSTEDKRNEPCSSIDSILNEKLEETKPEEVQNPMLTDSDEPILEPEADKANSNIDNKISTDEQDKEASKISSEEQDKEASSIDIIDRIEEAKSNLSEFLKVDNDPPQDAVVMNEFEDNLESERDKIIEDLISTTESSTKEDLLTYTAHFDVLNTEKEEIKPDDSMDVDITSKKTEEPVTIAENVEEEPAAVDLNVEDKRKELLDDENEDKTDENKVEETITEVTPNVLEKNDADSKDTSKDDIDTLLSTLMPELESTPKPIDVTVPKKQSIQYLREVLDKSEDKERGAKRKISTDSESEEKVTKKTKVLAPLPELTVTKVAFKKRKLNFDDLMSNLTKIKLPSASWKVRISAGSNPFSIVEFHEKEKLLRSVKFFKEDFQCKILFNNLPVELLGAPDQIQTLDDVSVLLSIVNMLIKNDPVVHYL